MRVDVKDNKRSIRQGPGVTDKMDTVQRRRIKWKLCCCRRENARKSTAELFW